ncbi:multiple sugar transport system substrate-binding protein [Tessaracoccus bendigoensis DSM 12906]|uniref:Multiple sugar transport system substrate-binding protein n=1 Tax=Tessaracoccus bendigoensis DSM 12906 TaxID=1123357 RepID=A0A1M6M591_9ACTN|nr:sugar ABC transporter substrate-binding protein [Tessaracoccus bendigoensis]SHJ78625.1 multiple sugar transport system substrate-binding protein [Tessaracoccus bendigoensis DSM 12906]
MSRKLTTIAASLLTATLLASGCSTGDGDGGDGVIDYWLWDSAQQPGYQRCADRFQEENPELKVRITQYGWDDYWSKLTAGFIADQGPDVFTNHLGKYAQFVDLNVLVPLNDLEATSDLDADEFADGLAAIWQGQDGLQYGAPKDWDTIAYFYNTDLTDEAGITAEQLADMEWNPDDGGTFEQIIAHLTVDQNGVRGDEPGFDKDNVALYGLASEGGGGGNFGQTQWGAYVYSMPDWTLLDQNPWGTHFNMDDPGFQKTIEWYFGLAEKGYMPSMSDVSTNSGEYQQVAAGNAVLGMNGSWMTSLHASLPDFNLGIAPTPVGPSGHRASPFNGLADSVSRFSDDPESAAKWVAFMASDECQSLIGEAGVVFPARQSGMDAALAAKEEAGIDVSAFTVHLEEGTTVMQPVTSNGADITALTEPAFDAIYIGSSPASSLTDLNEQVNRLLELTTD